MTPDDPRVVIDAEFIEEKATEKRYSGRNSDRSRDAMNSRSNSYPERDSRDAAEELIDATARDVAAVESAIGRIAKRGRGILRALSKHVGEQRRPILPR